MDSKKIGKILDKTEKFIKDTIEKDFAPLKVKQFGKYDADESEMVGLVILSNDIVYQFLLEKADGFVMLKRVK